MRRAELVVHDGDRGVRCRCMVSTGDQASRGRAQSVVTSGGSLLDDCLHPLDPSVPDEVVCVKSENPGLSPAMLSSLCLLKEYGAVLTKTVSLETG